MTDDAPTLTSDEWAAVTLVMVSIRSLLKDWPEPLTAKVVSTALVSLVLNLCVAELRGGNDRVRTEMRRLAERLIALADTPTAQVDTVAAFLADQPAAPLPRA